MLRHVRRVTLVVSVHAPVPLHTAWVTWGDGARLDLTREQVAWLQSGALVYVTHVYAVAAMPYVIQFTTVDAAGEQAISSASVRVCNQPPQLALAVQVEEQTVTVHPVASDPDGEVTDISVYWGGWEGVVHGAVSGQPLTHRYPDEGGLWSLLVTATDDEGASVAVRQYVALLSAEEAAAHWGLSPGARSRERTTE